MLVSETIQDRDDIQNMVALALDEQTPQAPEIEAERCRRSLHYFARSAFPVVEPGTPYSDNWHIGAICDYLEAVSRREITRLIINVPPRHMKSLLVAVMWPAWEWLDKPEAKYMFVSYAQDLSTEHSLKCRRLLKTTGTDFHDHDPHTLIERVGYQGLLELLYGEQHWQLTADQDAKTRFETTRAGYRFATSVGGIGTGKGGDYVVIDDPHKADEAESDTQREKVIGWHDSTIPTRFNEPKHGAEVVIMQRLHEHDLTGHLRELDGWTHLCLPAEYDPKHPFIWPDDPRSEPGELLWPERVGPSELDTLKQILRHRAAGQLQQLPAPAEGILFKRADFREWTTEQHGPALMYVLHDDGEKRRSYDSGLCTHFQTSDVAASEKETADFTVVGTWAVTPAGDVLLIDIHRQRYEDLEVPGFLEGANDAHHGIPLYIEDFGAGKAPLKKLKLDGYPARALKHEEGSHLDKLTRALPAQFQYEDHRVFHPAANSTVARWLTAYETELTTFPAGSHDDQVDVLAYAVRVARSLRNLASPGATEPKGKPLSAGVMDMQF